MVILAVRGLTKTFRSRQRAAGLIRKCALLVDVFDIAAYMSTPARKLSLGERMRFLRAEGSVSAFNCPRPFTRSYTI